MAERGNDFSWDCLGQWVGLFARGSVYHMVWANSAHAHSFLYDVHFHSNIRVLCNRHRMPSKPAEFTIWPFQKKLAGLWGIALST